MAKPFDALPPTAVQWPNAEWFSATSGHVQKARADLAAAVGQALSSYQQSMANYVGAEAVQPTLDAVTALQARFRAVCAERGIREDDIARMHDLAEKRQGRLMSVVELQTVVVAVKKEGARLPFDTKTE